MKNNIYSECIIPTDIKGRVPLRKDIGYSEEAQEEIEEYFKWIEELVIQINRIADEVK